MANQSVENVKGLFSNKATRVVVILTFGVICTAVILASMTSANQQNRPKELQAAVGTPTVPTISSVPGTSDNPMHNDKIRADNAAKAAAATASGESAVPRLTGSSVHEKDPFDILNKKPDAVPRVQEARVPLPAPQVAAPQAPQIAQQAPQKSKGQQDAEKDMAAAMAGLLNSWTPARQAIEIEYVATSKSGQGAQPAQPTPAAAQPVAQISGASTENATGAKKASMKAGTILFAQILTSVNSDEPGPVLAQVTSGPYAGGRLLGKFVLVKDAGRVIVSFDVLTMQGADNSYQIKSFAVNQDTARTGLATNVDNHYLSRYGLFAAAEFTKGYANALTQSGSTQTITSGPGGIAATTSYPKLTNKQIALSALGSVGEEVAESLKDGLKRPPTVTLDSGTAIGVLIMQDASF